MLRSDLRRSRPRQRAATGHDEAADATPARRRAVAIVVVLAVALAFGYYIGQRPAIRLQGQVDALANENKVLREQQPTCNDGHDELAQVRDLLAKAKPELAVKLVEARLTQESQPLCPEAKAAFGDLWYTMSMDLLFASLRPEWPDPEVEQRIAGRWLEIERQANALGVPREKRLPSMMVATRAYNGSFWQLADMAFRRAWTDGNIGEEALAFRYALLRNWGANLGYKGSPAMREQAVRLLATAQAIADTFHLPHGEACADLQGLGYADCREPLPDPAEPVLAAGSR
jgi:hypothetical protein